MPPVNVEFDRNAVVTIQGGGVYGLSLLGQLQAVIDQGIQPVALAGTSAGAMVATFYWAGLQPDAIRDHFAELTDAPNGLINLIGPFDHPGQAFTHETFLHWYRRLSDYLNFVRGQVRDGQQRSAWRTLLRHFSLLPSYACALPMWVVPIWQAGKDFWAFGGLIRSRGLFSGDNLEHAIDRILRSSPVLAVEGYQLPPPPGQPGGRLLTFGDFQEIGVANGTPFSPLFLTATNLRSRRLELFDSTDPAYFQLPVARAVRASAGFPVFFQPVDVDYPDRDESYVDGGVICNFPAFVFAEAFRRRLLELEEFSGFAMRPWVHIGLRLTDGERPYVSKEIRDPGAFIKSLLGLATGAARTDLEGRAAAMISRSVTVAQPFSDTNGPQGVLAVEKIDRRTISTMFERGRNFARNQLGHREFQLPETELVEPHLTALLEQACLVFSDPGNERCQFRANIFVPALDQLVLRYRANMDNAAQNPDREIAFDFGCGLTGHCFTRRRPVICNLAQFRLLFQPGAEYDAEELFGFTPELEAIVRQDRTWLLSVPIMDPFGSYPQEIAANPEAAIGGLHYTELDAPFDGAVFGVINLDASMDYIAEHIPSEPCEQIGEARIQAILGIMRSLSLRFGGIFAEHFAR